MQLAMQQAGIVETPVVENISGAAGTIGLARFIGAERGNGDALLVSGLIMLGGIVTHRSPVTLSDAVPIARLTGEYEVLTVPTASPFRTLDDLLRAFKERPESISWGGGSAGGSDQILAGLIANAIGVEPKRVNYIAFSGGGDALASILGGQVSVGINGLAEFAPQIEAGTVRVLAYPARNVCPGSTRRHCASKASMSSSRTGAPSWRRLASTQTNGAGSRRWSQRRSAPASGAKCSRATAGSIAISLAKRSRASPRLKSNACATFCASSAQAWTARNRFATLGLTRCSCSPASCYSA